MVSVHFGLILQSLKYPTLTLIYAIECPLFILLSIVYLTLVGRNLCATLPLSIVYLTLVYAIEYPIEISSLTSDTLSRCLPCGNINDISEYSRVKCYSDIPCACGIILGS